MLVGRGHIRCNRCGNTDIRILEINHIDGGGSKEIRGRWAEFTNNILNGKRSIDDLEILCKPCNSIHALELKYQDLKGKIKVIFEK